MLNQALLFCNIFCVRIYFLCVLSTITLSPPSTATMLMRPPAPWQPVAIVLTHSISAEDLNLFWLFGNRRMAPMISSFNWVKFFLKWQSLLLNKVLFNLMISTSSLAFSFFSCSLASSALSSSTL